MLERPDKSVNPTQLRRIIGGTTRFGVSFLAQVVSTQPPRGLRPGRWAANTKSAMEPRKYELKDGRVLLIRAVAVEDARAVLDYVKIISGESDFLSFGPGEFELTESEEEEFIRKCLASDNQLFILGSIDDTIVAILNFSGGRRPRVRHGGEFGMSVRKQYWGLGIGSFMLDTLIDWARGTQIVKKINLRVRTDNQRAILLYERKGFVREGTIRKEIFLDGKYFDHHWMGLQLRKTA
jgi:RimJ/RimL family protein N-acetyltransferase